MCNDYEQHVTWAQYKRALESVSVTIPPRQSELDLVQADDVRINDIAPVMRAAGAGDGGRGRCRAGADALRVSGAAAESVAGV